MKVRNDQIMRLKNLHKTHYRMNNSIKSIFIKIHIFIKLINIIFSFFNATSSMKLFQFNFLKTWLISF